MDIKSIGYIKELPNGQLNIRHWVIDDIDYPPTEAEIQEMVEIAKENNSYFTFSNN